MQNYRWPDGTYINNDYINVKNSTKKDIELKTQNRQKTLKTEKEKKLIFQNYR